MYYTGTRISEALQIKVNDINKDSIVICGKGKKYREILLPKRLKEQLKLYLSERDENKSKFLFVGQRGTVTRQTIYRDIKEYAGKARGIDKSKVTPHAFRHLYAKNLADLQVPPVVISQLLGHRLTITGLYMQVSKKDLLKIINKLNLKKEG